MYDLQSNRKWRTVRVVATDDTFITDFKAANIVEAKTIGINGSAVALWAWGKDTDNDDCTLRITGFMEPVENFTRGPGQVIWRGQLTLGSNNTDTAPVDDHGKWGSANDWFEVDSWDSSVTNGNNLASAIALSEATPQTSLLLLPTLGYTILMFEVTDLGGAGEMTEIGFLSREISMDGVV